MNSFPQASVLCTSGTPTPRLGVFVLAAALTVLLCAPLLAQQKIVWSAQEQPIVDQLRGLRKLPDDVRVGATKKLALEIRELPAVPNKVVLALWLASLSTEGDFGHDTLQEVASTLADALRQQPQPEEKGQPAESYMELASLVHYERVQASFDDPQFKAAIAKLEADDALRQKLNFTLTDLTGKTWTLKYLRGKVVLVNFWATWCPPCRKEMPDLESLYHRFAAQGFVVLAISDEDLAKVKPYIEGRGITYPILLDPGRKVTELFMVDGIPKSFVYDREGKLVAQSIDMRTQQQFLEMLGQAGLH
jgi:peroxiredoxin